MELEEPLLQGYMLLPPQGMLQQLKKSWHKKYCQIFKASKYGIQRLEIYDNQEEALNQQHTQRIITLEACIKISLSSQPLTFTLITKSGVHHFGCCSEVDMASWVSAFQSVAFKDESSSTSVEEDNDLYCTSGEGVFTVRISETEASRKCGLEPLKNYTLVVAATEMRLMDCGSHVLYTWPYQYIRKYGYSERKFTFEAGRRCGSGEGSFCLEHKNQLDIYRCFVSAKKKMKQMLSGGGGENSPTVECNDAQFHAALSMEAAGSRSPIIASVNTSKNLIDLDIAGFGKPQTALLEPLKPPLPAKPKPVKPPRKPVFAAPTDLGLDLLTTMTTAATTASTTPASTTTTTTTTTTTPTSAMRKLPGCTPASSPEVPQKSIVVQDQNGNEDDEKGHHPYDLVEVRSDAWRRLGLDNVPHTERLKTTNDKDSLTSQRSVRANDVNGIIGGGCGDNENDNVHEDQQQQQQQQRHPRYETMSFPSNHSQNSIKSNSPSIIHNIPSPNDPPDYDRLQHFGSIYKSKKKPGYRTPASQSNLPSPSSQMSALPSLDSNDPGDNNYDIVEDLSGFRLADDSHHGYGMIRKKSSSSSEPKHKIVNDSEYAIVSKPKRV